MSNDLFRIKQLIETQIAFVQTLKFFVDVEKAFENMLGTKLRESSKHFRINDTIIQALRNMYDKSYQKSQWPILFQNTFM